MNSPSHLRDAHKVDIRLPKADPEKGRRKRLKKLEADMLALMRESGKDEAFKEKWITTALAYFHGLPKSAGKSLADAQVESHEDGSFTVNWNGRSYWMPPAS